MSAPHEIISDEEIIRVHGHANFGDMSPREVVNDGVRKYAIGYTGGHTQLCILMEHGLITKPKPGKYSANLTQKGKRYARAVSVTHIDTSQAAVAAALEAAAEALQKVADNWDCGHNESRLCDCAPYVEQWGLAADEVRALIAPAQLSAANARADQARDAALVEAADIILADNYDDPDSAAAAILALRAKPAPAATVDAVVSNPLMQEQFADWFRRNYPGPDTIIGDPDWHAPRILNAAIWFINNHKNPRAIAGGGDE